MSPWCLTEGNPPGTVIWSPELPNPYVIEIDADIALDYGLRYCVGLPDPNEPAATLDMEICSWPASEQEPFCETVPRAATEGEGILRWGLDPSQYDEGFNRYSHTLTLTQGDTVVDETVLEWEVTYAP
jgi:hypothetical protein